MTEILIDIIRNSILITGMVTVMMMMIESLNIESHGLIFSGLRKTRTGQVVIAACLGMIPGCMGGFATVSLYTHRIFSFGALVAMMIASSGDEAFIMLAMFPQKALYLFAILFLIAIATGILVDRFQMTRHMKQCDKEEHSDCHEPSNCHTGYAIHSEDSKKRTYGWKRIIMFIGVAVFIAALGTGHLGHDHSAHEGTECVGHVHEHEHMHEHENGLDINLLSEDWMNVLFAGLSIIVLLVLLFGSDHFVEEHLWNHIVKKHLPVIFAWTFGVLLVLGIGLQYVDISRWISDNTILMILLAALIGIIPESGPHLIFVTLFAAGVIPFPVLLASSISQDGHASIPLLAESKKSFLWAKFINCFVALAAGLIAMLFI